MAAARRSPATGLLLAAILLAPLAAAESTTLIVEYKRDAINTAAAAAVDSPAAIAAVAAVHNDAAVAVAAAEERGASAQKRDTIAAIASEAAFTVPALAAITSAVSIAATSSGIDVISHTSYATVLRGAAINTKSSADAQRLKEQLEQNPAVAKIWYAGTRRLIEPILPGNLSTSSVELAALPARAETASATGGNAGATGLSKALASAARHSKTLDGSGSLICVIDTGINYHNQLYGSCTGLNAPKGQCKVVTGFNFVGDDYTGHMDGPPAVRGGPPTDCMGHGSMVASVAATSNGVAPGALLGSYRVFGCGGYAVDDIIIEAIDRAVRDGCDIINLSLASGSGFADNSVYQSVMQAAMSKGVLVVKAAGNAGADGPFTADVFTAVGAIAAASVGDAWTGVALDQFLTASAFSSVGPNPSLELVPHVAAPGALIPVETQYGTSYKASGTSFSSPYIAGVLALWLQSQQQEAAARGQSISAAAVSHAAALSGLVGTARGVKCASNEDYLEPIAKLGAGVIQVDSFLSNKLQVSPLMLSLPSAITQPVTFTVNLTWQEDTTARSPAAAAAAAASPVATYDVIHEPAASMTVSDGWYGTDHSIQYVYVAANVTFGLSQVAVDTSGHTTTQMQVTFTLPGALANKPLLYSGRIRLQPTDPALPAVAIPYQGYAQDWSTVRILARPKAVLDTDLAHQLKLMQSALCYAPRSQPSVQNAIMDMLAAVPDVCTGGFASSFNDTLNVSLAVLQESPECSLRITLVPETPLHTLFVDVLDASGQLQGRLKPLDTSSGSSLATSQQVNSFCLRFDGSYRARSGELQWLRPGNTYRLRARLRGPWAAADEVAGRQPSRQVVYIRGKFRVGA